MSTLAERIKNLQPVKNLSYYIKTSTQPSFTDRFQNRIFDQEDEEIKQDITQLKEQGKGLQEILQAIDETDIDKEKAKQYAYKFFEQEIRMPKMPSPIQPSEKAKEAAESFKKGAAGLGQALAEFPDRPISEFLQEKGVSPTVAGLAGFLGGLATPLPSGKAKKGKEIIEEVPKVFKPLAQEARKYKSAEEFVKNYNGGLILNREKVNNWIAGGPDNISPVSKLLGPEGKKFIKEMGLPDIPVKVQEASEETIGHYAQIEWRGGNKLKDARINMEISPTEEFGIESLASMEKNLLHELAHAKQIMLNRLGGKKIQSEVSEKAAERHANYILSKTKSQLINIYNQAVKKNK